MYKFNYIYNIPILFYVSYIHLHFINSTKEKNVAYKTEGIEKIRKTDIFFETLSSQKDSLFINIPL